MLAESLTQNSNPLDQVDYNPPLWAEPLLQKSRYKAAYGGRAGGKSHFFAEQIVRRCVEDPDLRVVCIREIQKSLTFSAKLLIESKIRSLGLSSHLQVFSTEIRNRNGTGIIIFQGMQDHTADSLKSLEGFGIAWVEEAQNLSRRSLELLRPTIRSPGSEIWFSWNPDQPEDAVDEFFRGESGQPKDSIVVEVNYTDNPHLPPESLAEMEIDRARDTDVYTHVWLGGYNIKSTLQVFSGKWRVDEFDPYEEDEEGQLVIKPGWDGPYYGGDWGFSRDPTVACESWIHDGCLWIHRESWEIGLEMDAIAARWQRDLPGIENHVVRADNSRPETINHVSSPGERGDRPCIPKLVAADKWSGSVEDGIEYLKTYKAIVIHERCVRARDEFRLYKWKTNRAGDPLPVPEDKNNHVIDQLRYAFTPFIKFRKRQKAQRSGIKTY